MKCEVSFGDTVISYTLKRSSKRQQLGITVFGQAVEVAAPIKVSSALINDRVREKADWIVQKLDANRRVARIYPRKMISGESLQYLGSQYQLKVQRVIKGTRRVRLWRGQFEMILNSGDDAEVVGGELLKAWYVKQLRIRLAPIVERMAKALRLASPSFQVRELGGRWGSCGKNGVLYFHWQLARLPLTKVEFVCAHELVHLLEPKHSKEFRVLLARLVPENQTLAGDLAL